MNTNTNTNTRATTSAPRTIAEVGDHGYIPCEEHAYTLRPSVRISCTPAEYDKDKGFDVLNSKREVVRHFNDYDSAVEMLADHPSYTVRYYSKDGGQRLHETFNYAFSCADSADSFIVSAKRFEDAMAFARTKANSFSSVEVISDEEATELDALRHYHI